jgi:hypothetical protein
VSHTLELAGLVVLLNLPPGYLRAGVKKFSVPWFIAVHAAIPLVALLRFVMGVGWRLATLPLFVVAYALGQFLGGEYRGWRKRAG